MLVLWEKESESVADENTNPMAQAPTTKTVDITVLVRVHTKSCCPSFTVYTFMYLMYFIETKSVFFVTFYGQLCVATFYI